MDPLSPLPHEDKARRQTSMNQKEGPHQTQPVGTLLLDFPAFRLGDSVCPEERGFLTCEILSDNIWTSSAQMTVDH